MFLLGKEGSGVSHQHNKVYYTAAKFNEIEEEQWKNEQLQIAIKYYKQVIDKIPATQLETKRKIQINLAQVLFDAKIFDEAVQIYEDAFNVRFI